MKCDQMEMLELNDNELTDRKLIVRAFGNENYEVNEISFRVEWISLLTNKLCLSVDISINKKQVKQLIKFLNRWLNDQK